MGRRNVQGEDVPGPRTKTLGNPQDSNVGSSLADLGSPLYMNGNRERNRSSIRACVTERLAAEGEELVVHRFGGSSVGFPSPSELRRAITASCRRAMQSLPSYDSARSAWSQRSRIPSNSSCRADELSPPDHDYFKTLDEAAILSNRWLRSRGSDQYARAFAPASSPSVPERDMD